MVMTFEYKWQIQSSLITECFDLNLSAPHTIRSLSSISPRPRCGDLLFSQDRERYMRFPGIAAQLVGGVDVVFDVDGRLFGLNEELAGLAEPEAVIRGTRAAFEFDGVLVDDLAVLGGVVILVEHIPAEGIRRRG